MSQGLPSNIRPYRQRTAGARQKQAILRETSGHSEMTRKSLYQQSRAQSWRCQEKLRKGVRVATCSRYSGSRAQG